MMILLKEWDDNGCDFCTNVVILYLLLWRLVIFGPTLCNALNTLFNVSFFAPEKLPLMAGALGWINK